MTDSQRLEEEGKQAYKAGKKREDNPCITDMGKRHWDRGWASARDKNIRNNIREFVKRF